jgi:hypothetical protein
MGIAETLFSASKSILAWLREAADDPVIVSPELASMIDEVREQIVSDPELVDKATQAGVTSQKLGEIAHKPRNGYLLVLCISEWAQYERIKQEIQAYSDRLTNQVTDVAGAVLPDAPAAGSQAGTGPQRKPNVLEEKRQKIDDTLAAFLAQDPAWKSLQAQREAAAGQLRAALQRNLYEFIRRDLNKRRHRALYRQPLERGDATVLDEKAPIATSAKEEVAQFRERPRGSMGLAGTRGCGKSTLLRATYDSWSGKGIRVLLPAPASYIPREFLVHLYLAVCQYILDFDKEGHRRDEPSPPAGTRLAANAGTALAFFVFPAVATLAGVFLMAAYAATANSAGRQAAFGGALVTVGMVPLVLQLLQRRALPTGAGSIEQRLMVRGLAGWSHPRFSGLLIAVVAGGALIVLSTTSLAPELLTTRRAVGATLLVAGLVTAFYRHEPPPKFPSSGTGRPSAIVLEGGARGAAPFMAAAAAQIVSVVAGAALLLTSTAVNDPDARLVAGALLAAAGAVALRVSVAVRPYLDRAQVPRTEDDQGLDMARAGLRRLRYTRSETAGWSGTVKVGHGRWLPVGADAATSGGVTDTEVPLGVPEIIEKTKELLGTREKALVVIDELDKIESAEKARELLNELKPLFAAENTIFLVSVSEDAIASFERRGLPFRDVFDSAFDEVLPMSYFSYAESADLINSRVLYVPPPFVALAHCLSGGLARDLVRITRRMVNRGGSLGDTARDLVHRDVRGKTAAVASAMGEVLLEPESSAVLRALHLLDHCKPGGKRDTPCLLDPNWLDPLDALGEQLLMPGGAAPADLTDRRTLRRLAMELVGYHYYSRTLLELFVLETDEGPDRLIRVIDDEHGRVLDQLSRARLDFMLNPYLAWAAVTRCRESLDLDPFDPPPSLIPMPYVPPAPAPATPEPGAAAAGLAPQAGAVKGNGRSAGPPAAE